MAAQNIDMNVEWDLISQKENYTIYQSGSHINGNFIQIYIPKNPCLHQDKLQLITYLHGFSLCMPKFYQCHLNFLANRGYYIFFIDFQKSTYPDYLLEPETTFNHQKNTYTSSFWFKILTEAITKRENFKIEDYLDEHPSRSQKTGFATPELVQPKHSEYIRIALAFQVLSFFSWFQPGYGKHLMQLFSTVLFSLMYSPIQWLRNTIDLTDKAWNHLCQNNIKLAESDFDFYLFGHSVGGLLALSWPYYLDQSKEKFLPQKIITADPVPSSEKGIPSIAILVSQLLCLPFVRNPLDIRNSGHKISQPVAILHGADDKIAKPKFWIQRDFWQKKSNFDYIASQEKQIYFSLSNLQANPPLIAFHNQAVTDTNYFGDIFNFFGGFKKCPNAYNCEYIWPGLNLIVQNQVRVDKLLDKLPLKTIHVTTTLPTKPLFFRFIIPGVIIFLVLFTLGFLNWEF